MKYILSEKYLLEENNLLCEADDDMLNMSTKSIKHNDKITKFLELLKKKQQEIQDFSDNFANLVGTGLDVNKTLQDITGIYKPLAQKLDKLNAIIPATIKKLENISDETAQDNRSILSTIDLLSKELNLLKFKEVSKTKKLDTLAHNLDATINAIIEDLDNLNDILDNTVDSATDNTKAPNNWQDYLNKAKKAGNLDDAWNYYLKTVWKEDAPLIKKLGPAFKIEVMYFGDNPSDHTNFSNDNPFIQFILNIKGHENNDITANLADIKENAYAHIHNYFNNGYMTKEDLKGSGKLQFNNVIYKADFYTYNGSEIDPLLRCQSSIMDSVESDNISSETLSILYNDKGEIRSLNDIQGKMSNAGISTRLSLSNDRIPVIAKNIAKVINRLPAKDINVRVRNLLALLRLDGAKTKAIKNMVLSKYNELNKLEGLVSYDTKDSNEITDLLSGFNQDTNSMVKLVDAIIPNLTDGDKLTKKEETTNTEGTAETAKA